MTMLSILFIIFQSCFTLTNTKSTRQYEKQILVLISFDGFRHDYIKREELSHFKTFAKEGVLADSLQPSFVTKTFPNHFTMVTGLYEESHGIVSNYMYDPVYNEKFDPKSPSSHLPKWWNATTPVWMLNELQFLTKNGTRTRKSATIHWPGSETSYNGRFPFYTIKNYTEVFSTKQRLDKIVELLMKDSDLNFVACYIEEPDKVSHEYGPDHSNTTKMLKELDYLFGYFIGKMERANLKKRVNVVVVSDHGMSTVKNIIYLTDYLNETDYDLINYGAFLMIKPNVGKKEKIYNALKKVRHLQTYYKKDIPEKWHYKHNRRITEIFAVADQGYYVAPNKNGSQWLPRGDHGYDNENMDMHGIFMANGPAFKKKLKIKTVKNIDLCNLICHILDLKPHPNNGTLDNVKDIVAERTIFTVIMKQPALIIALLSICAIFVLIIILGCTISCFRNFVESSKYRRLNEDNMPLTEWTDYDEVTEYQLGSK